MPTYQYACRDCDHRFEAVQSFSEASLTDCPVCSGDLRKVFSSVGIVFKGSGFYRTDSRKNGTVGATSGSAKNDGSSSSPAAKESSGSSTTSGSGSSGSSPATAAAGSST